MTVTDSGGAQGQGAAGNRWPLSGSLNAPVATTKLSAPLLVSGTFVYQLLLLLLLHLLCFVFSSLQTRQIHSSPNESRQAESVSVHKVRRSEREEAKEHGHGLEHFSILALIS